MFTKLKQKLAEEEHSDLGSSLPSSPSSSRKSRTVTPENKWQRRRLSSVSTYYGSRESVFTEPGILSRDSSFIAKPKNSESLSTLPNRNKPRKDLVSILHEKTQEIDKLQKKLSEYEEEIEKWRELYEEQLKRKQELSKTVEKKNQLSRSEIEAKQKALAILEKSTQLDELDQEYKEQKKQLSSMMVKLDELTQQRSQFESAEKKLKQQIVNLETENKTLKDQLNELITEVTQKSVELSKLEKCLEIRQKELNEVQEKHDSFKRKSSSELSQKEEQIKRLETRLTDKEVSMQSETAKSEDEWLVDGLKDGADRSSEINALATLVGSLNEKLERKDKELTSCKRVAEDTISDLNVTITNLEEQLTNERYNHKSQSVSSNDQLDALRQRNSYLEKELESVRSQLTSAKRSKENRPTWRRSSDTKQEERSRLSEKEIRQKEARYESQLADLQEERDQLQSELLIKDEECAQVSLCLEDALKNTSDLKKQIRELEKSLEEKTIAGPGVRNKVMHENSSLTGNVEIMEALRQELEESRTQNKHISDILHERDDTIKSLRDEVKRKNEDLRVSKTKLLQFEENNVLADSKRIPELTKTEENYSYKEPYKQTFALKTRLKDVEAKLRLREDVEHISLEENENLRKQIIGKDMRIKALQQKLVDLKKAFQRELKSSSIDCLEINGTTEDIKSHLQAGLLVSSSTQTDNDDFDYLNMNFKYLKHVIIKYMCSTNEKSRQMLPIVGHLLRFSPKELDLITSTFEWKLPLDY